MNGHHFFEALQRLDYPSVGNLDSQSFDWMFDNEELLPFLEWFCDGLQTSNVLHPKELEEYSRLENSEDGVLDGPQLEEVLHNLSSSSDDELSDERLQEDIIQLQDDVNLCSRKKDILLQQRNKLSLHQTGLTDRLHRLEQVDASAKQKYTSCLHQSQADNIKMNKSLGELISAVSQLSALYRTADAPTNHRDQNMVFLSQVDLHPYLQSEERFTQELTAFTKKQFFEGIADMTGAEEGSLYDLLEISDPLSLLIKGQNEETNLEECKDHALLQAVWPLGRTQTINSLVQYKSTVAACEFAETKLRNFKNKPYPQNVKELSAKLQDAETAFSLVRRDMTLLGENEIPALVKDSAALTVTEVLRGNYNLKISRQEYFSYNQDKVVELLLMQRSRNEFLEIALELELRGHHDTHRLLTATGMLLRSDLEDLNRRKKMMEEASSCPTKYQRATMDSRDNFLTRLHQILRQGESGKHQLFITYQELGDYSDKLNHQVASLRASLSSTNSSQNNKLAMLESNLRACQTMVHAESTTTGGPPVLSPQPIIEAITQVDGMLKKVEQAVMDIMRDIDSKNKKLKTDPLQQMEHDLFPQFFNNPNKLRRSVEEVTSRQNALLVQ